MEILIKILFSSPFILVIGSLIALLGDKINSKLLTTTGIIIFSIFGVITFFLALLGMIYALYSIWVL